MDLARLRFGDWVMGFGGLAVLVVMFMDWYETPEIIPPGSIVFDQVAANAWQAFTVSDVILALAAAMALTAILVTVIHPTAALPLAVSSLTTLVSIIALVVVVVRLISTPDVGGFDTDRTTGAWLGLVATAVLVAGSLASIRDERLPRPENPAEPRLSQP